MTSNMLMTGLIRMNPDLSVDFERNQRLMETILAVVTSSPDPRESHGDELSTDSETGFILLFVIIMVQTSPRTTKSC